MHRLCCLIKRNMEREKINIDELLLLEFLRGTADEETAIQIRHWLDEEPAHQALLDQLESLWLESGKIIPSPVAVDTEAALQLVSNRIHQAEIKASNTIPLVRFKKVRPIYKLLAAASVILLAWMGTLFFLSDRTVMKRVVAIQNMVRDTLPDGSAVCLNPGTTLTFPAAFDHGARNIRLSGKAFFDIKHKEDQPFTVDAGIVLIRVIGTKFTADASPGDTARVAVMEGTVKVSGMDTLTHDSVTMILSRGETGLFSGRGAWIKIPAGSLSPDAFFWANQTFVFRNTALSQVFVILESHFPVNINTLNEDILKCRLSASFENEPVERIMEVIAGTFGFELKKEGTNYRLTGTGCHE